MYEPCCSTHFCQRSTRSSNALSTNLRDNSAKILAPCTPGREWNRWEPNRAVRRMQKHLLNCRCRDPPGEDGSIAWSKKEVFLLPSAVPDETLPATKSRRHHLLCILSRDNQHGKNLVQNRSYFWVSLRTYIYWTHHVYTYIYSLEQNKSMNPDSELSDLPIRHLVMWICHFNSSPKSLRFVKEISQGMTVAF